MIGDPRNFATAENHTTILSGPDKQTIWFDRAVVQSNYEHSF